MSISKRTTTHVWAFYAALGALLSFAPPSSAAPDFPQDLATQLDMPCLPACTICHQDLNGGFGTVVKPFGKAMQKAGLTFVFTTVPGAIATMVAEKTDTDGDGVDDITELSAGIDPNDGSPFCGANAPLTPRYGCGAHMAPAPADHSGIVAAFFVASVLGASAHRAARRRKRGTPASDA